MATLNLLWLSDSSHTETFGNIVMAIRQCHWITSCSSHTWIPMAVWWIACSNYHNACCKIEMQADLWACSEPFLPKRVVLSSAWFASSVMDLAATDHLVTMNRCNLRCATAAIHLSASTAFAAIATRLWLGLPQVLGSTVRHYDLVLDILNCFVTLALWLPPVAGSECATITQRRRNRYHQIYPCQATAVYASGVSDMPLPISSHTSSSWDAWTGRRWDSWRQITCCGPSSTALAARLRTWMPVLRWRCNSTAVISSMSSIPAWRLQLLGCGTF